MALPHFSTCQHGAHERAYAVLHQVLKHRPYLSRCEALLNAEVLEEDTDITCNNVQKGKVATQLKQTAKDKNYIELARPHNFMGLAHNFMG